MIEEQNLSIFLQTLCKYESMACYYYYFFVLLSFAFRLNQGKFCSFTSFTNKESKGMFKQINPLF